MPGLVPGIHALAIHQPGKDVDGRDQPGHDELLVENTYFPLGGAVSAKLGRDLCFS
jgi:hypothetical protein